MEIEENAELYTLIGELSTDGLLPGESVRYELAGGDNPERFRVEENRLLSAFSFDYEFRSNYRLRIRTVTSESAPKTDDFTIQITDIQGVLDTNGIADATVASRYPQVNQGDFVIFNRTRGGQSNEIRYGGGGVNSIPDLKPPAKVLMKGDVYRSVYLTLDNMESGSVEDRVKISNFLGQVYATELTAYGGSFWRLTGKYDPLTGTGDPHYPGCNRDGSEVNFSFSHGSYGIHISREWADDYSPLYIRGYATGFEIDHIEVSDGGFAGLVVKHDDIDNLTMDDVHIHHMYIHDIGSEGIYLGSTQPDPQHQFNRLLIENCVIIRTGGESLQVGQLDSGCIIRNNILWGAFDWLSPFSRWQDNGVQIRTRNGGTVFSNNIVMGGAGTQFNIHHHSKPGIIANGQPIVVRSNLSWGVRGPIGGYFGTSNGVGIIWQDNYWGYAAFDYGRVYTGVSPANWIQKDNSANMTLQGNRYETGFPLFYRSTAGSASSVTASDNIQTTVPPPQFINLLGQPLDTPYLSWTRWTALIGEESGFPSSGTRKGTPAVFKPGEVVQVPFNGKTRFYRCLQENAQHKPPAEGDDFWELLTWTHQGKTFYCPPDDARMMEGSFYHQLEIGLRESTTADANENGLPDAWEHRYKLPPGQDATDDADGDGRTNLEEFLANTDPMDPEDVFKVRYIWSAEQTALRYFAAKGRIYQPYTSADLSEWSAHGPLIWGTGTFNEIAVEEDLLPLFLMVETSLQPAELTF